MNYKTATDQAFGGRRVKLGMTVIVMVEDRYDGKAEIFAAKITCATCADFEYDEPLWLVAGEHLPPRRLEFVASEALLAPGCWAWPERI